MLEISNIKKDYVLKDEVVNALKGVSVCFRKSEFVSILGASGCGKTTLLNIIGGLDRYTDGDLIIDGVSTKEFKDKDWDNYRNNRVGFVFQSYNLIPHQTILQNVELALTLSGVSRKERRQRAIEVLGKVGLSDKLKSKPNQLSGGQMQRVAIARALVNNPEIILADEPTGALDSKTSVQIMDLLKEVSKQRLVIMVTHNPELAEQYSSRIIKLKDGELVEDSKPYSSKQAKSDLLKRQETLNKQKEQQSRDNQTFKKKPKKKSMSYLTALSLSFKNLLTKKARTLLVAFAGSIGIIGIALVLALSNGFTAYINKMQEDTLSTYPITIEAKSVDFTSIIMDMFMGGESGEGGEHGNDAVYPKDSITHVLDSVGNSLKSNDLTKFKQYLETNYSALKNDVSAVQYTYNLNLEFNTISDGTTSPQNVQPNSTAVMKMITKYSVFFFENKTNIKATELSGGSYRLEKQSNTNYTFIDQYPTLEFVRTALENPEGDGSLIIDAQQVYMLTFTLLGLNDGSNSAGGISTMMSGFGNMNIFNEMLNNSEMIKSQYTLVGENSRFPENANEAILVLDKNQELDEYILYALGLLEDADMNAILKAKVKGDTYNVKIAYDKILNLEYGVVDEADYFMEVDGNLTDIRIFNTPPTEDATNELYNPTQYYALYSQMLNNPTNKVKIVGIVRLNDSTNSGSLKSGIAYTSALTEQMVNYHNEHSAVTNNKLSSLSLDTPETINIYVNSFESKEVVQKFVEDYNAQAEEGDEITYTDMVGIIMSTVSIIINSITYVLIAFVSVSLIVSSIMIGIITYISVIERTKEIGVLRSVGASKRDIKRVFTAENFIIGLTSGVTGILVTLLALLPINAIIKKLTAISGLAVMPWVGAIVLILISVLLTFIAGLFPAQVASKKDPVIALRTE